MGYDGQGLGKEGQGILILVVGQQRPKHVGLGFSGQQSNISSAQITFVNARWIVKEAILIKEKVAGKWPCRIPLKYACKDLEERKKVMILPSRSSPAIGGPSNQVDKHHYKLKMYGTLCLVFFVARKGVIMLATVGSLEFWATQAWTIANTTNGIDIGSPNLGGFNRKSIPRTK